jgi:Zn-dependent protease
MDQTLLTALAIIPALVIAIVFHEVAHGWTALALGDPTAKERKRLTLNPIRHVDPIGTLVVPGILFLSGLPTFGWAKPVPVMKRRLNNPRFGMMAVAAAGPATNFILAIIGSLALGGVLLAYSSGADSSQAIIGALAEGYGPNPTTPAGFAITAAYSFILINLFLGLFNLLPIPPFDGSHVVEGLLPRGAARLYNKLRPVGFVLLFTLLLVIPYFFPKLGIVERLVLPPVLWALGQFLAIAGWVAGG